MNAEYETPQRLAARFHLPVAAVRYLISHAINRLKTEHAEMEYARSEAAWITYRAAEVVDCVAETSDWDSIRLGIREWRHELSRKELRVRKGQLQGTLARLYEHSKTIDKSLLSRRQAAIIDKFVDLAEHTLSMRKARRREAIRRMRDEKLSQSRAIAA